MTKSYNSRPGRISFIEQDVHRKNVHGVRNQCIHYALTRPAVATVMPGVHTTEQLQANLACETAPDSEKDYAAALASFPKLEKEPYG